MEHYVYVYRNLAGDVIYVGYGRKARRSISHVSPIGHNPTLKQELKKGYTLEIAGPFGEEPMARAIETALISVLSRTGKLTNKSPGETRWRFRPLGVPQKFIDRLDHPSLFSDDLTEICRKTNGMIIVYINDKNFDDGRPGDPMGNLPNDRDLAERMDRWWQLAARAKVWAADRTKGPGLLLAVSGTESYRLIVGSLLIQGTAWARAVENSPCDGLITVPHAKNLAMLDALKLRGRRIDKSANLIFGALRQQSFILYGRDGKVIAGGNKTLRQQRLLPSPT